MVAIPEESETMPQDLSPSPQSRNGSAKGPCARSSPPSGNPPRKKPEPFNYVYPTSLPSGFWDDLSMTPLCAAALQELNRRYVAAQGSSHPTTPYRSLHLHAKRAREENQFERPISPRTLKKIQHTARHGGPCLAHLRGLTVSRLPCMCTATR